MLKMTIDTALKWDISDCGANPEPLIKPKTKPLKIQDLLYMVCCMRYRYHIRWLTETDNNGGFEILINSEKQFKTGADITVETDGETVKKINVFYDEITSSYHYGKRIFEDLQGMGYNVEVMNYASEKTGVYMLIGKMI